MARMAQITLHIDPAGFKEEAESRLTKDILRQIAEHTNEQFEGTFGYVAYEYKFVNS